VEQSTGDGKAIAASNELRAIHHPQYTDFFLQCFEEVVR